MKALDTNVLIRFLVQDDPAQAQAASHYLRTHCTRDQPGFINRIVLCEIVWVLESAYGYSRAQIAEVIEKLLQTSQLTIDASEAAWIALAQYAKETVDFADALIATLNKQAGCRATVTFDKKAARLPEFELLRQP